MVLSNFRQGIHFIALKDNHTVQFAKINKKIFSPSDKPHRAYSRTEEYLQLKQIIFLHFSVNNDELLYRYIFHSNCFHSRFNSAAKVICGQMLNALYRKNTKKFKCLAFLGCRKWNVCTMTNFWYQESGVPNQLLLIRES